MKSLPNLYALRFILCLIVIIYHLPPISKTLGIPAYNDIPLFEKGLVAVYYFFSLSGFLILRLIYLEIKRSGKLDFKNFYSRRIRRLYPVYYLVLIIGIVLYHGILPALGVPFDTHYDLKELISYYILLVPNIFKYNHPDLGSILIVLWSIGVEEQFYVFIPIFMYIFRKKLLAGVFSMLLLLVLMLMFMPSVYRYSNFYFYFLFGGFLSIIGVDYRLKIFKNRVLHIFVYLLFVLSLTSNFFTFQKFYFYHTFNMIVSGLLITLISDYPLFVIRSKFLDYLGKISYGIYMYHMIVITGLLFLVSKFELHHYINTPLFLVLLNLLTIICSIIVAHLSFRYFESRFYTSKVQD